MGEHHYKKPEAYTERGLCLKCGVNKQKSRGDGTYKTLCSPCNDRAVRLKNMPKLVCGICGFMPSHNIQMDIDHIDGDHLNNSKDNLQILCANCHRLKTWQNQDWKKKTPPK